MSKYKIIKKNGEEICVLDIENGRAIPTPIAGDTPNSYYQEYQRWLAAGNTPDVEEEPPAE